MLDYLQAENAYTDAMLKPQQALRETLYEEMVARIPQQEHSVPYVRHGYRYQTRYEPGNEYAISVRQPQAESEHWEVLIDGNQRAENHEFYTTGGLDVSPDNQRLGWRRISCRAASMTFASRTRPTAAGRTKCWRTPPAASSGPTTPRRCTTCASTQDAVAVSGLSSRGGQRSAAGRADLRRAGRYFLRRVGRPHLSALS